MAIKIRKKGPRRPDEEAPALEAPRAAEGPEGEGEEHVVDAEVLDAGGSAADRAANPLEREELAEPDRFVEASVGLTGWFQENWKLVAIVGGVALTGVVGYMIWDHMRESAEIEQGSALNQAIVSNTLPTQSDIAERKSYQQQIALTYQLRGQPLPPDFDLERLVPTQFSQVYATPAARSEAVLQAAQGVVDQYPTSEVVGEAKLLAAAAALQLGRSEEARELASGAEVSDDARIFVLQLEASALADAGSTDEAVARYREILEAAPKYYGAFALLQIGTLLEQAGQREKAADAYAELVARFPESEQVEEGNRRLGLLVDDPRARIEKVSVE